MAGFLDKIKGTMRGGSGAGRGDNPHPRMSDPFNTPKPSYNNARPYTGVALSQGGIKYNYSGVDSQGFNQHGSYVPGLKREAAKTQRSYSYGSVRPPQGTREGDLQAAYVADKWHDFK